MQMEEGRSVGADGGGQVSWCRWRRAGQLVQMEEGRSVGADGGGQVSWCRWRRIGQLVQTEKGRSVGALVHTEEGRPLKKVQAMKQPGRRNRDRLQQRWEDCNKDGKTATKMGRLQQRWEDCNKDGKTATKMGRLHKEACKKGRWTTSGGGRFPVGSSGKG